MICLPLKHPFQNTSSSLVWLEDNSVLFFWRRGWNRPNRQSDYFMAVAATTYAHTKRIQGWSCAGTTTKGETVARFDFIRPSYRAIPPNPFDTDPKEWPRPQNSPTNLYNFKFNSLNPGWDCRNENIAVSYPAFRPDTYSKRWLLPKSLTKYKLQKNQILIHDYSRLNTRIFDLDAQCKALSFSPDNTLTLALTSKYAYFFDNDAL